MLEVEIKAGQADKVNRNIYGTNLLMRAADGQSYYYMYNGHADVTALINTETGNVDATYYYDAFGNLDPTGTTGNVNNNITYAGYQYDEETGLYYLNARMYDPKIARFLQEDTYTGSASDPLSLNLYSYVKNNPLIYIDPTGHAESMFSYYLYNVDNDEKQFGKGSDVYKEIKRVSSLRDKSKTLDEINYYNAMIYSVRNNSVTVLDNRNIAFSDKNIVWQYIGINTYEASRHLAHSAGASRSIQTGNNIANSGFSKLLTEAVPHNRNLNLSADELAFLFLVDPEGVKAYWDPPSQKDTKRALREETFKILTGENIQYYVDDIFQGWIPTDRTESSWGSRVRSNADFLLKNGSGFPESSTEYFRFAFNAFMVYLGAGELSLLIEGVEAYGYKHAVNMYTSGTLAGNLNSRRQYQMNNTTLSIADDVIESDGAWGLGASPRGKLLDQKVGSNLNVTCDNFPVVDDLQNGVLTSNKSYDLSAVSNQKGLGYKIVKDINKLNEFTEKSWSGTTVRLSDYSSKQINVIIPNVELTEAQMAGIEQAQAYAEQLGIIFKITVAK